MENNIKSWRNIYFLKSDVTTDDIWKCIFFLFRKEQNQIQIPSESPRHISYDIGDESVFCTWKDDESKLAEFYYIRSTQKERKSLKIYFEKNVFKNEKVKSHRLYYEETAKNTDLSFCWEFFRELKKFVPGSRYLKNKINNDIKENKEKFYSNDETFDLQSELVPKITKPVVCFYADKNCDFLIPENDIVNIKDDLWFTEANFEINYGMAYYYTKENFLKKYPDLKTKTDNDIKEFIEDKLSKLQQKADLYIYSDGPCFSKDEEQMTDIEIIKKHIIESISDNRLYIGNIKDSHDLMNQNYQESQQLKNKSNILLKERGLDANSLDNLIVDFDDLKQENLSLETKNKKLENRIQELEISKENFSHISEKDESTNMITNLNEIENLKKENKELKRINSNNELIIKELRNKCSKQNQSNVSDIISLKIPYKINELFPEEITDYLYNCLYSKLQEERNDNPANKEDESIRKKDVLADLLECKTFEWNESETKQRLSRIEKILSSKTDLNDLSKEGFVIKDKNGHQKIYFVNPKYLVTFSSTPSDQNNSHCRYREIKNNCFLV